MKRILTAVFVLLASLTSTTVLAQGGYQVKGVVVDAVGPVIGAAVVQQGTTNGTSTGIDGDFVLNVPSGDALIEISCIGYATQVFKASEVPATVTLAEDTHFLDEVVVIGYGTVKKSDLTGSVSTVKADEINKGVVTSPTDLLRGKSAGVVVTAGDGMPGSGATVRIRGGSSINASNTPLYVIDGLPVSNDGISGMSDPMASINPEDIESFTVLKDASATAIYGSRASNGVIVITTKKGSRTGSSAPKVAADFTTSVNTIAKYNNLLDADGLVSIIRDFYGANSAAEQHLGVGGKLYNTDWQKEIYQVATTFDANLSLTGRLGSFLPYRVSTGVIRQQGTLKGSEMDRVTLGLNLSPSFFDNHLTVNVNGKGTYALNWYANQGAIGAANHYDPTKPVYNNVPGSNLNGYTTWYDASGNINTMATMNPVALLDSRKDMAGAFRFIGNTQFDYKIHGFEDLRLNLNLGIDWAKSEGETLNKQGTEASYHNTTEGGLGSHTDYDYLRRNTTLEFYADYNHTFAEKHFVDLMAGYSWQHFWSNSHNYTYRLGDKVELSNTEGKGELYLLSFFGRANYSFADRYLITATVRADGTSRFQNNKWGIFPSVALGWNIKNEPFMTNVEPVSTLKLRLSWGETGQQEVGGYYETFAQFLSINTPGSYYFVNGGNYTAPVVALGYSANLKWETTTTYNAGMDFGFWHDRLTTSVDVYKRDTRDILNYIPVPGLSNLTNYLNTNIGSMTNKGVEVDVNAVLAETRDLSWTFGVNGAYNKNIRRERDRHRDRRHLRRYRQQRADDPDRLSDAHLQPLPAGVRPAGQPDQRRLCGPQQRRPDHRGRPLPRPSRRRRLDLRLQHGPELEELDGGPLRPRLPRQLGVQQRRLRHRDARRPVDEPVRLQPRRHRSEVDVLPGPVPLRLLPPGRQLPQAGQLHPGLHVPETLRSLAGPSLLPERLRYGAEHLHLHPLHGHRP